MGVELCSEQKTFPNNTDFVEQSSLSLKNLREKAFDISKIPTLE